MGVATAAIGVLRRPPLLLAPAVCPSVVVTSIQLLAVIGTTGLASGASSPGSSRRVPYFWSERQKLYTHFGVEILKFFRFLNADGFNLR